MVYLLEHENTCFLQRNVNPMAMPMLSSNQSPSILPAIISDLELLEPEGQQEIEVWHGLVCLLAM